MPETIFFSGLHLKNIKGLNADYFLNLKDDDGNPVRWTVLLGNNNTGKTTLLRCFASMQVKKERNENTNSKYKYNHSIPNEFLFKDYHSQFKVHENYFVKANLLLSEAVEGKIVAYKRDGNNFKMTESRKELHDFFGFEGNVHGSVSYGYEVDNVYVPTPKLFDLLKVYGYGTSRRISDLALSSKDDDEYGVISLFSDKKDLLNIEEWLLQLDYAKKNGVKGAEDILDKIINLITSEILPGLTEVKFLISKDSNFKPQVEVLSNNTWVHINDLGYGYQATMAWLADLAKRMFDRYPELENPLHGPAIVLVDEIDLHLHPEWQRKIIKYLSDLFPNTQFIVTAHSPLIVQSAENVNLIMLEKDEETGSINVRQQFGSFQGWTVEEILRELMDMGEKTRSDRFLNLLEKFEKGLLEEDYDQAKAAYDELDKILHPASSQRKLLSIQLSSLVPA